MVYIKRIAELEAELKFKEEENHDQRVRLNELKDLKRSQMEELLDQISEMKEKENLQYQTSKELKFYKEKAAELDAAKSQNAELTKKLQELKLELKGKDISKDTAESL